MHLPYLTLTLLLINLSTSSILPYRNITISSRQAEICDTCQPKPADVINAALEEELAITRQKKCKPLNAKCKKTKHCCMGVCRRAMLFKYCVRPKRKGEKGKKKFEVWQGGPPESDDDIDDEEEDAEDDTQVE